jgi:hypothetical protein
MKFGERWKEFLKTAKKPEPFDDGDRLMAHMGYVWGVRGWGAQPGAVLRANIMTLERHRPEGGSE